MGIGNQNFYVIEEFISRGTLKGETFAGRNFRDFADFGPFRESLFRKSFEKLLLRKIFSIFAEFLVIKLRQVMTIDHSSSFVSP